MFINLFVIQDNFQENHKAKILVHDQEILISNKYSRMITFCFCKNLRCPKIFIRGEIKICGHISLKNIKFTCSFIFHDT